MSTQDSDGLHNQNVGSLMAIDEALQALAMCSQAEVSAQIQMLCRAILTHVGRELSPNDDGVEKLFGEELGKSDRRFIAICLLRLLSIRPPVIEDEQRFRVNSVALFDAAMEFDIYRHLQLMPKQQTYEKLPTLRDASKHAEETLDDAMDALTDLDHLEEFRQQLMKTLSQPLVKAIISPFLPHFLKVKGAPRLRDVFEAVAAYRQAPLALVTDRYTQATATIEDLLSEVRNFPTMYTQRYLDVPFSRICDLLKRDFAASDFARPAHLTVRPLPKKYPLRQHGHDVSLGFVIENHGPGPALNVVLRASAYETLLFLKEEQALGEVGKGVVTCSVPARVVVPQDIEFVHIEVEWRNVDGTVDSVCHDCELESQQTGVDWSALEFANPYSLEPVETFTELVGRREIINQLVSLAQGKSVGSAYIYGQKRVGKTSIAKAFKSRLEDTGNVIPVYLESGEYIQKTPEATVSRLGTKLCQRVSKLDRRLKSLTIPAFDGALGPFADFLESAHELVPDLRLMFILDEFDELPVDVYRRSPLGDAFFLTLRTISGKPPFGFVLVGGEKMEFVMSCQGEQLNKFQPLRVDYFDKTHHWADYHELVTRPTKDWLEFDDGAILTLYEQTAGNPFYTVYVCRTLFDLMRERRDCHATRREIDEAVALVPQMMASNSFQHFWEDGIFEASGDRVEEISIRRRRILLALADTLRAAEPATKDYIASRSSVQPCLEVLDPELQRFVQRRVLVERSGVYDCHIPLFQNWLVERGVHEILTTFSELDTILLRRQKEEQSYVQPAEVRDLTESWDLYQGKRVTTDHVRAWLEQFGDYANQRLMFTLLQGITFYSQERVREKLRDAHGIIRRKLAERPVIRSGRQRNTGEVLISYLDGPGKSGGGAYARLYAKVNAIYVDNVVERNALAQSVTMREGIQAVVFVDDFVGTGGSAQADVKELAEECGPALRDADVKLYYVTITGFQESVAAIRDATAGVGLDLEVLLCDPLDATDKGFSERSPVFQIEAERLQARQLAYEYGVRCEKDHPLGYGDSQALIVFPEDCPNNSLPILWASAENPPFHPLFRRPLARK